MTGRTVLAVDLGGSALKACVFDVDGAAIASASVPLSFREERSGWSEQEPELWWRALGDAVAALRDAAGARFRAPAAIGLCGFTRTQVLLGSDGAAVRPAFGFRDARASDVSERLLARPEVAAHPQARHLNAFHPLARLAWLAENAPDDLARTRVVLEPKDFLAFRLTGRLAADGISHLRLIEAVSGAPSIAEVAGFHVPALPRIAAPTEIVGDVRPGLPGALADLAGAAVVCGSHDTLAAVAGLGALRPGIAYGISGSSEVFGLLSETDGDADGLLSVRWGELWQIGGPGLNGANVLDHLLGLLAPGDRPVGDTVEALLTASASARPLVMLPFLHGERVPYWDAALRAAIVGLSAEHGPGDVLRAGLEGVAFLNRVVLERAEAATGTRAREIRLGGGGARSAAWNQIRADVLGRPVLAAPDAEMGLLGCLAFARVALGLDADIAGAADALPRGLSTFRPDEARAARYDRLFTAFAAAVGPVAELSRLLADIR